MESIEVVVKENEQKFLPIIWINGKEEEISVNVRLVGEGASLKVIGIFLGNAHNSVRFNTDVKHEVKNTKSRTTLRGVFFEHASFNNDAMIRIQKGSGGADGYFASKVLLFDDARGRSVPSLEIDENDLKVGHAATIGRPDEEQLFYLRCRGLSEKEAQKLIVSGFFAPLLSQFPPEEQLSIAKKIEAFL